jgi:TetR/AcrR family transcriptional regulator, transcriptional repressor for nem operon
VRREQLLDAAERVLVERGLAATTVADVAEAAAVAKGTVYLYFESKSELLSGLRARYFERFAARLGEPPGPAGAAGATAARVERLVAASYDFALAHHALHHVLFHESGFGEVDVFARARQVMAELVEAGRASGEIEVADPELATEFLLHGLHGLLVAGTPPPRFPKGAAGRRGDRADLPGPRGQARGRDHDATCPGAGIDGSRTGSGTGSPGVRARGRTPAQMGRS